MRLVLDTNVVIAAVMGDGPPGQLIELAAEGSIDLVSSETLVTELADVLSREHVTRRLARKGRTPAEVLALYEDLVERIVPAQIARTVSDPDDDAVLACALAAGADLIVSGDAQLLNLKSFHRIPIVNAAAALTFIAKPCGSNALHEVDVNNDNRGASPILWLREERRITACRRAGFRVLVRADSETAT